MARLMDKDVKSLERPACIVLPPQANEGWTTAAGAFFGLGTVLLVLAAVTAVDVYRGSDMGWLVVLLTGCTGLACLGIGVVVRYAGKSKSRRPFFSSVPFQGAEESDCGTPDER